VPPGISLSQEKSVALATKIDPLFGDCIMYTEYSPSLLIFSEVMIGQLEGVE
jgi:hypothetical protein